jgi:acetylornithine/N-succinyldiaminopimelate aminotransferase
MTVGTHGTTYGGNPLAMAVGNAVLDVILAPGFIDGIAQTGLLLRQRLAELQDRHPSVIEEIRGEGLMVGIKTRVPNTDFVAAARAEKLLTIPAGDNVVRLLPPLIVTDGEVNEAVERLSRASEQLEQPIAQKGAAE